uniref:Uncharacterized protein n=1 Tax=Rhipicephalus appendiculatus TaxID=34631 RepID=A0A131YD84_RHIAP
MQFYIQSTKQKKIIAPIRSGRLIHKKCGPLKCTFGRSILNQTWCIKLAVHAACLECIGQGQSSQFMRLHNYECWYQRYVQICQYS